MATATRVRYACGTAGLSVVTRHSPADTYLCGALHIRKGWYWYWSAISPTDEDLVSTVKGPFVDEDAALADARAHGAAIVDAE